MTWKTRIATAAVLAVAIACLPLVLDECAASCASHHEAVASTPSCHHAASTGEHLGRVPPPCHHDHTGTLSAGAIGAAIRLRTFESMTAEIAPPVLLASDRLSRLLQTHVPSETAGALHATSLPLRV